MTHIQTKAWNHLNNRSNKFQGYLGWKYYIFSVNMVFPYLGCVAYFRFYPRWLILELLLEIIQTAFLTNYQNIWAKHVASRVITKWFWRSNLSYKPLKYSFLTNLQDIWNETIASRVLASFSNIVSVWPKYYP
jgi:hypothetical protein